MKITFTREEVEVILQEYACLIVDGNVFTLPTKDQKLPYRTEVVNNFDIPYDTIINVDNWKDKDKEEVKNEKADL